MKMFLKKKSKVGHFRIEENFPTDFPKGLKLQIRFMNLTVDVSLYYSSRREGNKRDGKWLCLSAATLEFDAY